MKKPATASRRRYGTFPGDYPLNIVVYDWGTGRSTNVSGTLSLEATNKVTLGIPEFSWSWEFLISEPDQGNDTNACVGETFMEFLEDLENVYQLTIPTDDLIRAIRRKRRFDAYIGELLAAYETVNEQDAKKDLEEKALEEEERKHNQEKWDQSPDVRLLISRGFEVHFGKDWSDQATSIIGKSDVESFEALLRLGAKQESRWWKMAIQTRSLPMLLAVASISSVNDSLRSYTWNGVYHNETPLTLVLRAGWREAVALLLARGAETERVISFTNSRGRTDYHDILGQITALAGVDPV